MTLDKLLADVFSAPHGPEIGAFFDYDGTVITGYSATTFYSKRLKDFDIGPEELVRTLLLSMRGVHTEEDFGALLELASNAWSGKSEEEMEKVGRKLFTSEIAGKLHTEVWELAEAHRAMGHTVVLASSATRFQVEPMAEALGADHVLCTPLEVADGLLTGRTGGTPLWGNNKAQAVIDLARSKGIDLTRSFGYSNGNEDVPFLSAVGHPTAVQPDKGLREEAERRGWPVLDCVPRGKRPGVVDIARTGAFYGAFAGAFVAGLGAGLLNRNRHQIIDITSTIGTDLGFALAGVNVEVVEGAEHLWSRRPAVFIFNHQSNIDAVVAMKLVRTGYTGVAKKEAKNIPGFGQLFQIADVAFIDRGNVSDPRAILAPAVEKLRNGLSIVLAPEGTRSPTPRLGPFKKGAFHIARQAGVPIVSIVMKGQNEVMWRGSQTVRPGRIEVVVLPPVETADWKMSEISKQAEKIRNDFLHTLSHWPGRPAAPELRSPDTQARLHGHDRGDAMTTAADIPMASAEWGGGSDVMNAFESLMWRVEDASPVRSTCVGIELLDGTPDWADVVETHQRLARLVPRLRHRVVAPPMGLAPPRWAEDPNFDLHYHLRRTRLPDDAGWVGLLQAAEKAAMRGFDRARPPWEAVLYEGLPEGKSAYVLKLHHSISDGLGIMKLLSYLNPSAGMSVPLGPELTPRPAKVMSPLDALRAHTVEGVLGTPQVLRKAGGTALRALSTPTESVRSSLRYTSSLKRVLSPPAAEPSPLLAGRSTNWRFAALDVDFAALRAAAKTVGASINDAYLAALLGGYRLYHEAMGAPPQPVPVAIPMSLRKADEAHGGNDIASARLAGPMDIVDPTKRMLAIGEQVRKARDEPAMNNLSVIAPAIARLPAGVIAQIAGGMTKANDLQASNVPGPRVDVFLAGVRVERLYGYAPLPGCPAMITLATHGPVACVGVNYDAAAFTHPGEFIRALAAGFDEVLAVGSDNPPPTLAR